MRRRPRPTRGLSHQERKKTPFEKEKLLIDDREENRKKQAWPVFF